MSRETELCTQYGHDDKITPNSAYAACVASFQFNDKSITQDDITWLIQNVEKPCGIFPLPEGVGEQSAILDRVVDADTIDVFICPDGMCELAPLTPNRIRLWHISGPSDDYPSGVEATDWLSDRLPVGSEITFDNKGQDPYERILGIVYDEDGNNINELLIAAGFAKPWTAEELLQWEQYIGEVLAEPPEEKPVAPSARFTGVAELPYSIRLEATNWVGAEFENIGTMGGRWWIGIRLVDEFDVEWMFTGLPDYATEILPGETKMLWCLFTPPDTLHGDIRINVLLNKTK